MFEMKFNRLEKHIQFMEEENKKGLERNKEVKEIFKLQEELTKKKSDELLSQKIINRILLDENDQLRYFYDTVKEACKTPEILSSTVNRIIVNKPSIEVELSDITNNINLMQIDI